MVGFDWVWVGLGLVGFVWVGFGWFGFGGVWFDVVVLVLTVRQIGGGCRLLTKRHTCRTKTDLERRSSPIHRFMLSVRMILKGMPL